MSTTTTPANYIIRNTKTLPSTIASTGLKQEEYNLLRHHLKTVLVPGSVGFEGYGIGLRHKTRFLNWFQALIEEIGPIYWPGGRSGFLSWQKDRAILTSAVLKVVRFMSKSLRRSNKKPQEEIDVTKLGGVAGAVQRIGVLHDQARTAEFAKCVMGQMVLQPPHNDDIRNEDYYWEQFINWDMCEQEGQQDEDILLNACIDPRLLAIS